MNIGDIVTPKTVAGLMLADVPVDGTYKQKRRDVCCFNGIGRIIQIKDIIIDYDAWDAQIENLAPEEKFLVGKITYRNCLVECKAGSIAGWAGEGALMKAYSNAT